jgi:hypothetical protein
LGNYLLDSPTLTCEHVDIADESRKEDSSCKSPNTETIIGSGEPIEEENLVEFRLLYRGELLPCSNSKRRTEEKHVIRQQLHPQLRRLWSVNRGLRALACERGGIQTGPILVNYIPPSQSDLNAAFNRGIADIGKNWNSAGFDFVPLVTEQFALRCNLDILLLRPEEKKYIFEQGDIDGQLKTLFDAFRRPADVGEAGGHIPTADENPFFCLLQDDRLISEVHVVTDQLLLLPGERATKANDAFVVIHVKLNHITATLGNVFI